MPSGLSSSTTRTPASGRAACIAGTSRLDVLRLVVGRARPRSRARCSSSTMSPWPRRTLRRDRRTSARCPRSPRPPPGSLAFVGDPARRPRRRADRLHARRAAVRRRLRRAQRASAPCSAPSSPRVGMSVVAVLVLRALGEWRRARTTASSAPVSDARDVDRARASCVDLAELAGRDAGRARPRRPARGVRHVDRRPSRRTPTSSPSSTAPPSADRRAAAPSAARRRHRRRGGHRHRRARAACAG